MPSLSEMTPKQLAEASVNAMWKNDITSRNLGMSVDDVGPGTATVSMVVTSDMANGLGTCHGGHIFSLADSAFGFACNSYSNLTLGQHCSITYLMPCQIGDRLTAFATEVSRRGRSGIYDIRVTNQSGDHVAEFRGHSRTTAEKLLIS